MAFSVDLKESYDKTAQTLQDVERRQDETLEAMKRESDRIFGIRKEELDKVASDMQARQLKEKHDVEIASEQATSASKAQQEKFDQIFPERAHSYLQEQDQRHKLELEEARRLHRERERQFQLEQEIAGNQPTSFPEGRTETEALNLRSLDGGQPLPTLPPLSPLPPLPPLPKLNGDTSFSISDQPVIGVSRGNDGYQQSTLPHEPLRPTPYQSSYKKSDNPQCSAM